MTAPYDKVVDLDRLALFLNNCDNRFAPIGGGGGGGGVPVNTSDLVNDGDGVSPFATEEWTLGLIGARLLNYPPEEVEAIQADPTFTGTFGFRAVDEAPEPEVEGVCEFPTLLEFLGEQSAQGTIAAVPLPYGGGMQVVTVVGASEGNPRTCARLLLTETEPEWGDWMWLTEGQSGGCGDAIPMLGFDPESTSYDFTPGTYAFRVQEASVSVDGVVQWASLLTHLQNEGMSVSGSYDGATGVLEMAKLPYGQAVQTVTVTPNNGVSGSGTTTYPVYVCTRRYLTGMTPAWGPWYTVSKPTA